MTKTQFSFAGTSIVLGFCAIVAYPGLIDAQVWQPVDFTSGPISLFTTGGIAYAEYNWVMGGCLNLEGIGPLIQNGRDFSLDFRLQTQTSVVCPEVYFDESATVVLGALAPGTYTLTTTSWSAPVTNNTFVVATNRTPELQPIGFAADGTFQIQLNGAANVGYILQYSTNLVNWVSLSTNSIRSGLGSLAVAGPCTTLLLDMPPSLPFWRAYRVQVLQTVALGPGLVLPSE